MRWIPAFATAVAMILQLSPAQAQAQAQAPEQAAPFILVLADADDPTAPRIDQAWWGRSMRITPTGTVVSGVPIQTLNAQLSEYDAQWCFADALTPAAFAGETPEIQADIDRTMADTASANFAASGRFTRAGRQTAVVGAFQTCQGEIGSFLLITDAARSPGIVYLHKWDAWKGFIWLHQTGEELSVGSCFECDHAEYLYFDRGRRAFYWETPDF